jgi:hypothetical protein
MDALERTPGQVLELPLSDAPWGLKCSAGKREAPKDAVSPTLFRPSVQKVRGCSGISDKTIDSSQKRSV